MENKDFNEKLIEKLDKLIEENTLNAKRKNKILTAICVFLGLSALIQLILLGPIFELILNVLSLYFR